MSRRFISIVLSVLLIIIAAPADISYAAGTSDSAADNQDTETIILEDGTYADGEVIVRFSPGAVSSTKMSLHSAQKLENIDEDFGETMAATGEADEAAMDAKSEAAILKDILGDDFLIRDSISFDEDLTVALVSSDKYDTAELIEKLSADDRISSAEANLYIEPQSYDYSYSLNDELNSYNYQANTPLANNEGGYRTSSRGSDSEYLSTNAGSIQLTDEEKSKEIVVAVMDSGITEEHEDLKNMLWENPGNIGLEGEHGYNFYNNVPDVTDTFYHGTHCSGIIAAEPNNGVGIAGTAAASGANIKIMMVSTNPAGDNYDRSNSYKELGAFNYILKAKQRGVNIVASSNSWSASVDAGTIYDEVINRLGEEGIVTFVAAGNYWKDLDNNTSAEAPVGGDSPYVVSVGAAGVSGEPAAFTNYGKSTVDIFAPGLNILSTVCYSCYFPNIYNTDKLNNTTEYYGLFDSGMVIGTDDEGNPQVTPSKGDADDSVKCFRPSVFHAQLGDVPDDYNPEDYQFPGSTTYELEKATNRTFTDSGDPERNASLKLTIHNAKPHEKYFFYFPYDKNPKTTSNNTKFSAYIMNSLEGEDYGYSIFGGEVIADSQGNCRLSGGGTGEGTGISETNSNIDSHFCETDPKKQAGLITAYDELKPGETVGIGICLSVAKDQPGDIHLYLDSIGVSRPFSEIPEEYQITPETSYNISSGTSMATPACAGAYAAYAACHPIKDGQTGSDYALSNRAGFLSCVTRTEELKDMCATGGYIDLTRINEVNPIITDAVCSLDNDTITIYGEHLNDGYTLRYRKLEDKSKTEITLPSDGMDAVFAGDGKSIVIKNARQLFGTYLEFLLYDNDSVRASGSFFTVKGQKHLTEVWREVYSDDSVEHTINGRKLITDTKGQNLYAFEPDTGKTFRYDGHQFNLIRGTDIKEAALQFIMKEKGFDDYDRSYNLNVGLKYITRAICTDNKLYHFVDITHSQGSETLENEEVFHYLASLDYTADKPAWSFTEISSLSEFIGDGFGESYYAAMKGKVYCIGNADGDDKPLSSRVYSCDTATGKWSREADMPAVLSDAFVTGRDGKLYFMLGGGYTDGSDKNTISHKVYCFDGSVWTKLSDIPFTGKHQVEQGGLAGTARAVCAPVKNAFIFFNCTADGYGNSFLYHEDTGKCEPLYYTINDSKAEILDNSSAVETQDGVYFMYEINAREEIINTLCLLPRSSGEYESSYDEAVDPVNPVNPDQGTDPNRMGTDGTPVGPGASAAAAEKAITSMASDADPQGTVFSKLRLKSTKQTKTSIDLGWTGVNGAVSYVIYGNKCGNGNKPVKLAVTAGNKQTVNKINDSKLAKGTYYKFIIVALDRNHNVVSTSKVIHVATKGGKVGNHKKVTVKKSVIKKAKKLKKGKSLKLKAKATPQSKKRKVKKHVGLRYESTDNKIATVSKKGVVKGKNKGTCYIYAYAQNGVFRKIKVTVK